MVEMKAHLTKCRIINNNQLKYTVDCMLDERVIRTDTFIVPNGHAQGQLAFEKLILSKIKTILGTAKEIEKVSYADEMLGQSYKYRSL